MSIICGIVGLIIGFFVGISIEVGKDIKVKGFRR